MTAPMSLAALQRWFQEAITHPDGIAGVPSEDVARTVAPSAALDSGDRLAVYADAYWARLLNCLADAFPVLCRALGEDVFNGYAAEYLERHPSHSYTLDRLGDRFSAYFDSCRLDAGDGLAGLYGFLAELARLEWTIGCVFDGPGGERDDILGADEVARLALAGDAAAAGARLRTVPSLRLLELRYPANTFYTRVRALADGAPPPPIPGPAVERVALFRRDWVVRRQPLGRTQLALLQALQGEASLGEAVAAAAATWPDGTASLAAALGGWFRDWAAAGLFRAGEAPA